MNGFETMMWRANRIRPSPVLAIELLDSVPDWDRFVSVHQRAAAMLPRLRQRVVEAPLGLGAPHWSADPAFELGFHVWRTSMCDGDGWAQLLERAARWAQDPFARARPPWEAVLCEGLPEGHSAYVIKMHHSLADGLGAAQLLERLHSPTRENHPDTPPHTVPATRTNGLGALVGQLRHDLGIVPHILHAAGTGARDALTDPAGWVSRASRYGQSLYRTLSPPNASVSPLLAGRGLPWRFATLDVALPGLRAAARANGATLNDAYLAALLGGYRRYHQALGAPVPAVVPVGVPVSLRRPGEPSGGNRIAGARFAGPVGVADPAARVRAVARLMRTARRDSGRDVLRLFAAAAARLPPALIAALIAPLTAGNDLQAGLLPGPRGQRYLAGAKVRRVYPFAPLPGCPAMISMVAYRDLGCLGINFDPAAFGEPEAFLACLREGFTEVAGPPTAARIPQPARRPTRPLVAAGRPGPGQGGTPC